MLIQAEAAPPVVQTVMAEDVDEQHLDSQLPLVQEPSVLHETPLPFLAEHAPPLR